MSDLRYAIRTLITRPGFTAIAVLTIALGIGANIAIFSVLNAVLWRPLPYPHPERLTMVWVHNPREGFEKDVASYLAFNDWPTESRSFEHLAAYFDASLSLTGAGDPVQVRGSRVTASFFPTLDVQPALGRWFTDEEAVAGHERSVILSHGLWQERFGGDPALRRAYDSTERPCVRGRGHHACRFSVSG